MIPSTNPAARLPAFGAPPVIEVAVSLQFAEILGLDAARLGLYWASRRDSYPSVEYQPRLPPQFETFDRPQPAPPGITIETELGTPRFWLLNQNGTRLIQLQPDRLVVNWRKLDTDAPYPSYDSLRKVFVDEVASFSRFLKSEGLPTLKPTQVELTYVNHLPAGQPGASHSALQEMVQIWQGESDQRFLPPAERVQLFSRYVMQGREGPAGRLHIQIDPRYRVKDSAPVYVLQLTGRGAPQGDGLAGALVTLDSAHEWIVQAFAAITTPEMHTKWERTQ